MADEVLVTEFRLHDRMSAGMARLNANTKAFGATISAVSGKNLPALVSGFTSVGGAIGVVAGAALLATGAVLGFGNAASQAAGDYEGLVKGLEAYAGGAENLKYQLAVLKDVAKAPGLGFEEAIRGAVKLQAAGLGFETAANAITQFGNALALVGGGKAELDGVLLALTQIAAKGKISAEELLQIQERVPQIRGVVAKQFGTSDTEQLQKMGITSQQFISAIIKGLSELPRAGGSIKNERENIEDELKRAFITVGTEINKSLLPFMKAFGEELNVLAQSGVVKSFTTQLLAAVSIFSTGDLKTAFRGFVIELSVLPVVVDRLVQSFNAATDIFFGIVNFDRDRLARGLATKGQLESDEGIKGFFNQIRMTRELTGKRLDKSAEEFAKGANAPIERKAEEINSPILDSSKQVATNTAKLVELQQQQVDLQRQILGGGTVAGESASAVRLDRALGGSGGMSRGQRMILDGFDELLRSYRMQGMAVQRNNGVRGSTQVR